NTHLDKALSQIIKQELNVKEVDFSNGENELDTTLETKITPELKAEGDARNLIRSIQNLRKESNLELKDKIKIFAPTWPTDFEKEILSKTLAVNIEKSDHLKIEKIS
ncbi:MAG: DUF5915 domain-containing protein, partial [Bacteriovorax sp.]|nr:DUF5915 domain-containing protein [Bacteriovorax sp.]